jgi:hypothetical protein
MSKYCLSCGSSVAADAGVCPVCGEPYGQTADPDQAPQAATAEPHAAPVASAPSGAPVQQASPAIAGTVGAGTIALAGPPPASTAFRDYLLAGIGALVIAGLTYLISQPTEVKGPPMNLNEQQGQASGALPPGHPQAAEGGNMMGTAQATPQQDSAIANMQRQLAADPKNLALKLKLANLYYDVDRHAEAVPLYEEYLKAHPDDQNARTDMAFSVANNGDVDRAITELRRVIGANAKHQNAAYNLAMMFLMKKNRDSTLFWFKRVVAIDPTSRAGQTATMVLNDVERRNAARPDSAAAGPAGGGTAPGGSAGQPPKGSESGAAGSRPSSSGM